MAVMREARLVTCGVALVVGSAALALLRAPVPLSVFTLTFGVGLCVSSHLVVRPPRVRLSILVLLLVAFVAYRIGALVNAGVTTVRVVTLLVQAVMLGAVFALGYDHAHGLSQLTALFNTNNAGYAPVLDEHAAARAVEAELARSRRHGTPLTFLLLEPFSEGPVGDFDATVKRVSPSALTELQRVYARESACELISEHVRRSDVVVSWQDRFLVMSADTSAAGTEILAARMIEAAQGELGLSLRTGVAAFPVHGSTYTELIAVATAAARGDGARGDGARGDGNGAGAQVAGATQYEPPTVPHAEASQ
jgi:hypothetical protein